MIIFYQLFHSWPRLLFVWLFFLLLTSLPAPAEAATNLSLSQKHLPAFQTHNWLPTSLVFGVPNVSTRLLPASQPTEVTYLHTVANTYALRETTDEAILLDGEVTVSAISAQWHFNDDWQLNLLVPYIDHSSGILDDQIEDWHDWFGLPQGGRKESSNNQFAYLYRGQDGLAFSHREESGDLGDIRLGLARQILFREQSFVLQIELKAPTGDAGKYTGSGAWDLSAGIGWQQDFASPVGPFSSFATISLSYLGESDLAIAPLQEHHAFAGRAGLHWHALSWLSLTAQLDSHSKLYDSALQPLGDSTMQITFGGRLFPAEQWRLDIGFGEDLNRLATPDFVLNMALAYRF